MSIKLTDIDKKILDYLAKRRRGVPQNELWKKLKINSRDASRSLIKLESAGLIKREPIVHKGRRTYLVKPVKDKYEEILGIGGKIREDVIDFNGFLDIPCMYCPYIDNLCYEGGYYDPRTCELLYQWLRNNLKKT